MNNGELHNSRLNQSESMRMRLAKKTVILWSDDDHNPNFLFIWSFLWIEIPEITREERVFC